MIEVDQYLTRLAEDYMATAMLASGEEERLFQDVFGRLYALRNDAKSWDDDPKTRDMVDAIKRRFEDGREREELRAFDLLIKYHRGVLNLSNESLSAAEAAYYINRAAGGFLRSKQEQLSGVSMGGGVDQSAMTTVVFAESSERLQHGAILERWVGEEGAEQYTLQMMRERAGIMFVAGLVSGRRTYTQQLEVFRANPDLATALGDWPAGLVNAQRGLVELSDAWNEMMKVTGEAAGSAGKAIRGPEISMLMNAHVLPVGVRELGTGSEHVLTLGVGSFLNDLYGNVGRLEENEVGAVVLEPVVKRVEYSRGADGVPVPSVSVEKVDDNSTANYSDKEIGLMNQGSIIVRPKLTLSPLDRFSIDPATDYLTARAGDKITSGIWPSATRILNHQTGLKPDQVEDFFDIMSINFGVLAPSSFLSSNERLLRAKDVVDNSSIQGELKAVHRLAITHGVQFDLAMRMYQLFGGEVLATYFHPEMKRWVQVSTGAEGYEEAKVISDPAFRELFISMYPTFWGRIWKDMYFFKALEGQSTCVDDIHFPYGKVEGEGLDVPDSVYLGLIKSPDVKRLKELKRELEALKKQSEVVGLGEESSEKVVRLREEINYLKAEIEEQKLIFYDLFLQQRELRNEYTDETLINRVVKMAWRRMYEGEMGVEEIRQECLQIIRDHKEVYFGVDSWKKRSGMMVVRSRQQVFAKLIGMQPHERRRISSWDFTDFILSLVPNDEREKYQKMFDEKPNLAKGWWGLWHYAQFFDLSHFDYDKEGANFETYIRYLAAAGETYVAAKTLSKAALQAIDPKMIEDLGTGLYGADELLEAFKKRGAEGVLTMFGGLSNMRTETVQNWLKEFPSAFVAFIEAHADKDHVTREKILLDLLIMLDQLLESGIHVKYNTSAGKEMPEPGDFRNKIELWFEPLQSKSLCGKDVEVNSMLRDLLRLEGFNVHFSMDDRKPDGSYKKGVVRVSAGLPAYDIDGAYRRDGEGNLVWEAIDPHEVSGQPVLPLAKYGMKVLKKALIAQILEMYARDAGISNERVHLWLLEQQEKFKQELDDEVRAYGERYSTALTSGEVEIK